MADIPEVAPLAVSQDPELVSSNTVVDRRMRWAGLLIVLAVAVPPFLIASTLRFLGITPEASALSSVYRYLNPSLMEISSLALLVYVLRQNGQSLRDIGFRFQFEDLGHGILLIIGSRLVFRASYWAILWLYESMFGHAPPRYTSSLVTGGMTVALLFALMNPFFEELIVRAFLISEVTFLTGSVALAVTMSVLLQTSYHLYQGISRALGNGFVFLVFSVYYVKTRRLWPVILAHLWADVYAVVFYHFARTTTSTG